MTAQTDQRVLDAIKSVEIHLFEGWPVLACCLKTTDGNCFVGFASGQSGSDPSSLVPHARKDAEDKLARSLSKNVAERSC